MTECHFILLGIWEKWESQNKEPINSWSSRRAGSHQDVGLSRAPPSPTVYSKLITSFSYLRTLNINQNAFKLFPECSSTSVFVCFLFLPLSLYRWFYSTYIWKFFKKCYWCTHVLNILFQPNYAGMSTRRKWSKIEVVQGQAYPFKSGLSLCVLAWWTRMDGENNNMTNVTVAMRGGIMTWTQIFYCKLC